MNNNNKLFKLPMQHLLFFYMFILVFILLIFLATGIFFIDQYETTKKTVNKNLSFQLNVFEQDLENQYEIVAMNGLSLAKDSSLIIEKYLKDNNISINNLNNNLNLIMELQNLLFDNIKYEILKSPSSGAFIVLETSVNNSISNNLRSGIYLRRSSTDKTDEDLKLFRGNAQVGKLHDIIIHRSWDYEFDINQLNDYNKVIEETKNTSKINTFITDVFTLRDTSDRVILFMVPLMSSNSEVYGVCGFELSEMYFKANFEQASQLDYLSFIFTKNNHSSESNFPNHINIDNSFSVRVKEGNTILPKGILKKTRI